jgi:carbon-monoxide dehydrogenase small subunit
MRDAAAATSPTGGAPSDRIDVALVVNGDARRLTIEPRETLAEVLRDRLGLTGAKVSCDAQVCGACTVLVDGLPVSGCTFLAVDAEGRRVRTVEGLAEDGRLNPLQQAFIDEAAFQCGFCTPGMLMAATALLEEHPSPTRADVIHGLEGNLCRCTGYEPIVAAVLRAAALRGEAAGTRAAVDAPHDASGASPAVDPGTEPVEAQQ